MLIKSFFLSFEFFRNILEFSFIVKQFFLFKGIYFTIDSTLKISYERVSKEGS